jgi:hypothetical protein
MVAFLELVAVAEEILLMGVPIAIDLLVVVDTLGNASPWAQRPYPPF